mgnify:CR=1 FL=1
MLKPLEICKDTQNAIDQKIPRELVRTKQGYKYVNGATIIGLLNHVFGYAWTWKVDKFFMQESAPFKMNGKEVPQGPVAQVLGTLSVTFRDDDGKECIVSKSAFGSQPVVGKQTEQESCYKAAATDAMKKAASLFGIAVEFWRNDEEKEFFWTENAKEPDPWDEPGVVEKHRHEWDYLKRLIAGKVVTVEDLNETLSANTRGEVRDMNDLTPEKLTEFVDYVKKALEQEEEDPKENNNKLSKDELPY